MPSICTGLSVAIVTRKRRFHSEAFLVVINNIGWCWTVHYRPSSANRMRQQCYIIKCFFVFESAYFYFISRRYFPAFRNSTIGTVFPPVWCAIQLDLFPSQRFPSAIWNTNSSTYDDGVGQFTHSEFLIGRMQFDWQKVKKCKCSAHKIHKRHSFSVEPRCAPAPSIFHIVAIIHHYCTETTTLEYGPAKHSTHKAYFHGKYLMKLTHIMRSDNACGEYGWSQKQMPNWL